jgi:hypothetical protein
VARTMAVNNSARPCHECCFRVQTRVFLEGGTVLFAQGLAGLDPQLLRSVCGGLSQARRGGPAELWDTNVHDRGRQQ